MDRSVSYFSSATSVRNAAYHLYDVSNSDQTSSNRGLTYLSLSNVNIMLKRFLEEKGMSKEELAVVLKITVKSLERLFVGHDIPSTLLAKITLPLARLYCGTRW